jgi:hypothetical protein
MKKTKQAPPVIGRLGAEATLALHGRKAGVMADRRTRRNRSRSDRRRRAILDALRAGVIA